MNDEDNRLQLGAKLLGKRVYGPTSPTERLTGPWVVDVLMSSGLVALNCTYCNSGSGGIFDPHLLVLVPEGDIRQHGESVSDDRLAAIVDTRGGEMAGTPAAREFAAIANELLARRAGDRQRGG